METGAELPVPPAELPGLRGFPSVGPLRLLPPPPPSQWAEFSPTPAAAQGACGLVPAWPSVTLCHAGRPCPFLLLPLQCCCGRCLHAIWPLTTHRSEWEEPAGLPCWVWRELRGDWAGPRGSCDPALSHVRARPAAARGRCLLTPFPGGCRLLSPSRAGF